MTDSQPTVTRYLLGELTEGEQAAFEEAYFGESRRFEEVAEAENALLDDYVRGRLSPQVRARFEQVYLADPRRRERVKFAAALVGRVDRAEQPAMAGTPRWLQALFEPKPTLRWSLAAVVLLAMAAVTTRLVIESSRSRRESTRAEAPTATAPVAQPTPTTPAAPVVPEAPSAPVATIPPVTLALVVGPGVRGVDQGAPVTLVIPSGTPEVRLALSLEERDYPSYRVVLRAVGGAEILRQGDLRPRADRPGPAFTVTLPASQLPAGDYLLTLQGARGGDFEDLSQSLFRVEHK